MSKNMPNNFNKVIQEENTSTKDFQQITTSELNFAKPRLKHDSAWPILGFNLSIAHLENCSCGIILCHERTILEVIPLSHCSWCTDKESVRLASRIQLGGPAGSEKVKQIDWKNLRSPPAFLNFTRQGAVLLENLTNYGMFLAYFVGPPTHLTSDTERPQHPNLLPRVPTARIPPPSLPEKQKKFRKVDLKFSNWSVLSFVKYL